MSEHSFETVRPYVINHLKKNFWKLESYMDWDDAINEAQLQFVRTIKRLEKRNCHIENEKHLMSLFKTSWTNHFTTLTNKATKERFIQTQNSLTDEDLMDTLISDLDNNGIVQVLLDTAPVEVKQVLQMFLKSPDELVQKLQREFKRNEKICNEHLCLLLNRDPQKINLLRTTLEHFGVE